MIIDTLKRVAENSRDVAKPLYIRNVLKEEVQNYILHFVYGNRAYKDLIFTGGTCLRKIYGLPRVSEDLDFDYTGTLDIETFAKDIMSHFASVLQHKKASTKISGNRNTVYIKLPVPRDIGFGDQVVVRCDFSPETLGEYDVEVNSISTSDFTFFVRSYDLETLFANKIAAFLHRDFFSGGEQTISFKARDVFDLVWFIERSKKSGGEFQPNWTRLEKAVKGKSRKQIIADVMDKVAAIDKKEIKNDLSPYIESDQSVDAFSGAFKEILQRGFSQYLP